MSTYTDEPRAWVGCLACYNEGNLNGDWYSATDAAHVDIDELHDEETTHDELMPAWLTPCSTRRAAVCTCSLAPTKPPPPAFREESSP